MSRLLTLKLALALKLALIPPLLVLPSTTLAAQPSMSDAARCSDILTDLGQKPPLLEFVECEAKQVHGTKALVYEYRVAGRNAAPVEAHLMRSAAMPALRFVCCAWDSIGNDGRDGRLKVGTLRYEISMGSHETLHTSRAAWPKIEWFIVTVTHYLEDP